MRLLHQAPWRLLTVCSVLALCSAPTLAQITVEGIEDETVYADEASFVVVEEAGYDYTALLNDEPVPSGQDVDVARPDYYLLEVERRDETTDATESLTLQFIVRASERGTSERGLPLSKPLPPIPSAAAELEGASLELVAPASVPLGLEIPVAVRVLDSEGNRRGVNGVVDAPDAAATEIRLLRGVGSAVLASSATAGDIRWVATLHGVSAARDLTLEATTTWIDVSGTISAPTDWGEGARMRVTADLTIAAEATVTIGAGSIVMLAPDVEVHIEGTLNVEGSHERPVVFTAEDRDQPWGGFRLEQSTSRADMSWTFLTGSGADPDWFDNNSGVGSSHRHEQPLVYVSNEATAELTDCFLIDNVGQAGHGEDAYLTLRRCLVQRCITGGQYNRGTVRVIDSALVEFPAFDAPFEDDDNDGLYLTGGAHFLSGSLLGWALDDGVDAGSGSGGTVEVTSCWFESCYHEGMAWSESRIATVRDSVAINNGQGLECGFDDPDVTAERILSTANLIGARFGDNYDWDYEGFLRVTDSLLLYNRRDIWGRNWDDWTVRLDQMNLQDNLVSVAAPLHPDNAVWDPVEDAARLEPFLPGPVATVGVGLAVWSEQVDAATFPDGLPVRLSTFTPHPVEVTYTVHSSSDPLSSATLIFPAGQTVMWIPPDDAGLADSRAARVSLDSSTGADITGRDEVILLRTVELVPRGSSWSYSDGGFDHGTAWRDPEYDDASWPTGVARLGFGDDGETTEIDGGPSDARYPTVYFRRSFELASAPDLTSLAVRVLHDDGAVVYLNGVEVYRDNLPAGEIAYITWAEDAVSGSSEDSFHRRLIEPSLLRHGTNDIAVEVHQATETSSDLGFDLELVGTRVPSATPTGPIFLRGDANADGSLDVSDPVKILLTLFGGQEAPCSAALDADGNGSAQLTDAVYLLEYLFRAASAPPAPFPGCGESPEQGELSCDSFPPCQ